MFTKTIIPLSLMLALATQATEPPKEDKSDCLLEFTIPKKFIETESSGDLLRYVNDKHQSTLIVEKHDELESGYSTRSFAMLRYEDVTSEERHTEVLMQQAEIDGLDCFLISYIVDAGTESARYEVIALSKHCDYIYEWNVQTRVDYEYKVIPGFFEMLESAAPAKV